MGLGFYGFGVLWVWGFMGLGFRVCCVGSSMGILWGCRGLRLRASKHHPPDHTEQSADSKDANWALATWVQPKPQTHPQA